MIITFLEVLVNPCVETYSVCLIKFDGSASPALVIVAEAVFAAIMGAYTTNVYKALRVPELTVSEQTYAGNRSDPLSTGDFQAMMHERVTKQRAETLKRAQAGGE